MSAPTLISIEVLTVDELMHTFFLLYEHEQNFVHIFIKVFILVMHGHLGFAPEKLRAHTLMSVT